jgi:hypothetical protein
MSCDDATLFLQLLVRFDGTIWTLSVFFLANFCRIYTMKFKKYKIIFDQNPMFLQNFPNVHESLLLEIFSNINSQTLHDTVLIVSSTFLTIETEGPLTPKC